MTAITPASIKMWTAEGFISPRLAARLHAARIPAGRQKTNEPEYSPNWASGGKERTPPPDLPTRFEQIAEEIGVTEQYYVHSQPLKAWVKRNRFFYYVPEWLLREWGFILYDHDVSSML